MRRALLVLVAILGALLALTVALGHSGDPEERPDRAGSARSRAGAILAAARLQQRFADPAVLAPEVLRRRVEASATPDFAATMLRANEPGARRLAGGPVGLGLRAGIATVYFATPIGYRLLSYSPHRARVLLWGFTVLGNAASVEPRAYFGTSRTDLLWSPGGWKIAGTWASFGPTPKLATPRRNGEGYDLLELSRGLHRYDVAP